jgi:hypothetical protein
MLVRPVETEPAASADLGHVTASTNGRLKLQTVFATGQIGMGDLVRLVIGVLWIMWANQWYEDSGGMAGTGLLAVLWAGAGITVIAATLLVTSDAGRHRLDLYLFGGTLVLVGLLSAIHGLQRSYGTDELAYDQGAASSLLHGVNPYGADLSYTNAQFGVANTTVTLKGEVVNALAYPSLSFLPYVPAVALLGSQAASGLLVDIIAWLVGGTILWRLMREETRPLVTLFLLLPVPLVWIGGGSTDPLYFPLILAAVWRWDRFGVTSERTVARWIGPIALGCACAVKQTPWLLVPFLVTGIALEAHQHRREAWKRVTGRYMMIAAAAFTLPNLPFIVWNPGAWASSVFLPFRNSLAPVGLGPSGLARALGLGGGNLSLFGYAGAAAVAAALVLFVRHYPRAKPLLAVLALPGVLLSTRSLGGYFVFMFPVILVAATSIGPGTLPNLSQRMRHALRIGGPVLIAASASLLIAALAASPPLRLTVVEAHASGQRLYATVAATNGSDHSITPNFILTQGPYPRQPLAVSGGPAALAAHQTAVYHLISTDSRTIPNPGDAYQVEAVTTHPDTLSASPPGTTLKR